MTLDGTVSDQRKPSCEDPVAYEPETHSDHAKSSSVHSQPDICSNSTSLSSGPMSFRTQIVWRNVVLFTLLHIGALLGAYLLVTQALWRTWIWAFCLHICGGFGITAGAHRLWAHRSYKATTPLKIFLILCNCMAFQNHIIEWSRDHRCHHKWSETDADPHDARRGLFFSHVGWLMLRKHPEVIRKGKTLDMTDLNTDPLLVAQRRFYLPCVAVMCFVFPTAVPVLLWSESAYVAFYTAAVLRYTWTLNMTWTVNSFAHLYGYRPYDQTINPRQSYLSTIATIGEGWHNYHHTFPQDYRASEFPWRINLTSMFIDFCALLHLASDRKVTSAETIRRKKLASGEK